MDRPDSISPRDRVGTKSVETLRVPPALTGNPPSNTERRDWQSPQPLNRPVQTFQRSGNAATPLDKFTERRFLRLQAVR